MDLSKFIRELQVEKRRLDAAIATLEALVQENPQVVLPKRRGRKGMNAAERKEVSRRMKNYWAQRRKQGHQANA